MPYLQDSETWVQSIYQIQITDSVLGGPSGVVNQQATEIANRTAWLRMKIEQAFVELAELEAAIGKIITKSNAEWTAQNPVLPLGELGYESDTGRAKMGDGVSHWNALVYSNFVADEKDQRLFISGQSASSWAAQNPVLANGEIAFETDTRKLKIGDGSTIYNNLQYTNISVDVRHQDVRLKSKTLDEWTTGNPTLNQGEIGYVTDTGNFKIGNGTTPWNGLRYHANITASEDPPTGGIDGDIWLVYE